MKILITTDWYAPVVNGVVVSVLLLQRELEKLGHEVRVVTLAPGLRSFRRGPIYYIGSVSAGKIYPGARLRLGRSEALLEQLEAELEENFQKALQPLLDAQDGDLTPMKVTTSVFRCLKENADI